MSEKMTLKMCTTEIHYENSNSQKSILGQKNPPASLINRDLYALCEQLMYP